MYTENDDRKKKKNDNLTRFNIILRKKMTITPSYSQKKKKNATFHTVKATPRNSNSTQESRGRESEITRETQGQHGKGARITKKLCRDKNHEKNGIYMHISNIKPYKMAHLFGKKKENA